MAQQSAAMPIELASSTDAVERASSQQFWFDPRFSRAVSRAVLSLAILVLLAAAGLYAFRSSYQDKVFPSIYVMGADFGGKSRTEAESALQAGAEPVLNAELTFTYQGVRWTPTFADLGVFLNSDATLDALFVVGREEGARDRVASTLGLINGDRAVPLTFGIDETRFDAWIASVDDDLGTPGRDAYLVIEDGVVSVVPDIDGVAVDRARIKTLIVDGLGVNSPYAGELPTAPDPAAVHVADLATSITKVEDALAKSIKLVFEGETWKLTPSDLGKFVVQTVEPGKTGAEAVDLSIDREALADYLSALLREDVNSPAMDATIAWNAQKNRVMAIEESRDGASLKATVLADKVIESFWTTHKAVRIPVTKIVPTIDSDNLDRLGITTRLAVGDSNFDGSDGGRSTNIAVGAQLLNGALVPPKSEFTFNHSIGEITVDKGYVEASVVDGERIGKDIGGGICQVSTTVFRAAFYAGLPITEWHPHRYRLGFYELDGWPPGLDASILQPEGDPFGGGDFRFENPTDSWMLIESYVDGPRIYVIIYGPDLGYDVHVSEPWYNQEEIKPTEDLEIVDQELPPGTIQQTEYALSGMEIGFQRTVYDRNGAMLWDRSFATLFYPRGNVYKVSPDMKGESPAA